MVFSEFLTSPLIAVFLIVVLVVEGFALSVLWKTKGVGLPPMHAVSFLGAGAAFAVALGIALSSKSAIGIAACLIVAFALHLTDLLLRWQKQS